MGGSCCNTQSAPTNGSFSLINKLLVKLAGKPVYNVHKAIFTKNLLPQGANFNTWTLMTQQSQIRRVLQQTKEWSQGTYWQIRDFFQPLVFVFVTIRDLQYCIQRDEFPC